MSLNQRLVDAAIAQALAREGEGSTGAAAVYLCDGRILTSVALDTPNDAANLCHETGALCEANRLGVGVAASVCVSRLSPKDPFVILPPCGLCQERLAVWGLDVEVAVPLAGRPGTWQTKLLRELQPFYWYNTVVGSVAPDADA